MSIFPEDYTQGSSSGTTSVTTSTTTTPKLLKEYAIDFDAGEILLTNGKFTIVEGIEAVKVRCWLALQIQRNRYIIYPSGIGNNLKSLIGKGLTYINKNIQSTLEDALVDGEYVTAIEDISVTQDGSVVTVDFTINSIYGSYDEQTTV